MEKTFKKYWWVIVLAAMASYWYFKNRKATALTPGTPDTLASGTGTISLNPATNTGIAGGSNTSPNQSTGPATTAPPQQTISGVQPSATTTATGVSFSQLGGNINMLNTVTTNTVPSWLN